LGLELTPPSSPDVTFPAFNTSNQCILLPPNENYNNNSTETPPGFFERASEICDGIEDFLIVTDDCDNDIEFFEKASEICDGIQDFLNVTNDCNNDIGPSKKTVTMVYNKTLLPFEVWRKRFMVKTSKSGRTLKGTSILGSPYADPFLHGLGGKRKKKAEAFWSTFNFSGGVEASPQLLNQMADFCSKFAPEDVANVLYDNEDFALTVGEICSLINGGFLTENVSWQIS
jgi:hypothetical protein